MQKFNWRRRRFLAELRSASVATLALVVAPAAVWSKGGALSEHDKKTLRRMVGLLFPLEVPGDVYDKAAGGLIGRAAKAPPFAGLLRNGIKKMDAARKAPWIGLPEAAQIEVMTSIMKTPFFFVVRDAAVSGIFNDKRVWKLIGYEGSAIEHGGYLDRGFNDIDWVPKT